MELLEKFWDAKVLALCVVLGVAIYFLIEAAKKADSSIAISRNGKSFFEKNAFGIILLNFIGPVILGPLGAFILRKTDLLPSGIWPFVGLISGGASSLIFKWTKNKLGLEKLTDAKTEEEKK